MADLVARARGSQLFLDMPPGQYHEADALGSGSLKLLARSPWHFKNRVPVAPTKAMLRGTLVHCALLEPDAMGARYVVVPEDAPKRPTEAQWNAKKSNESSRAAKEWWTEFARQAEGKEFVSANDFNITQLQLVAVRNEPTLAAVFGTGWGEVSGFWRDPQTGIDCKARWDWVHPVEPGVVDIADLKATADESPRVFGMSAARLQVHLQAAHYVEGFELITKLKVRRFIFAAVTSVRPVLAVPYVLTDEIRDQGRDERRELLERLAWCRKEDQWPAYGGSGVQLLDFPAYAKRSAEVDVSWAEEEVAE
jgi:hypothetical protein